MYKDKYEECCRIADIDNNEDVILFDVGVNIMDLPISKFGVNLINPIDNNIVLDGFKLGNNELVGILRNSLKDDKSLLISDTSEELENIILNRRYLNKRYSTLSAKSGRKKCKVGFPIIIPKSMSTQDSELYFEFIVKVNENLEIQLLITKSLSLKKKESSKQQTAEFVMNFFKGGEKFVDEVEEGTFWKQSNYELRIRNHIREELSSTSIKIHDKTLNPARVELQENEEKNILIIEFVDESDILLGYNHSIFEEICNE